MHTNTVEVAPTPRVHPVAATGLGAWLPAVALNAAVFVGLQVAGYSTELTPPGGPAIPIAIVNVVLMTTLAVAVGTGLLALTRSQNSTMPVGLIGLAVGVGTALAPLSMQGDLVVRGGLALMHVIAGVAWFATVQRSVG